MQWKGPYVITEKVGPLDYRVDTKGKLKTFHINMLRHYVEREDKQTDENDALAEASVALIDIEQSEDCEQPDSVASAIPALPSVMQTETIDNMNLNPDLTSKQKSETIEILKEFPEVFTDIPGKTHLIECDIRLTSSELVKVKQYPMPHAVLEDVKTEVQNMIKMDVIERSESPYSFPIVMIKKKDGTN